LSPTTAQSARTGVSPRVLKLAMAAAVQTAPVYTVGVSATAFHATQRRLTPQRDLRASRARTRFSYAVRRLSGRLYRRSKGKFRLVTDRKRKHPRKPRSVRLVYSLSNQTVNYIPPRSQPIAAEYGASPNKVNIILPLRNRL
jgi:hypothetical protein